MVCAGYISRGCGTERALVHLKESHVHCWRLRSVRVAHGADVAMYSYRGKSAYARRLR